jgi:hypothetical protein
MRRRPSARGIGKYRRNGRRLVRSHAASLRNLPSESWFYHSGMPCGRVREPANRCWPFGLRADSTS